jgi:excinuclease UvrABC nuclease subunit
MTAIPGVGEKTSKLLLRKFGSVQSIERQTLEALSQEIAPRLARRVYEHFHPAGN